MKDTHPESLKFKIAPFLTLEECLSDFEPLRISNPVKWEKANNLGITKNIICTKNYKGSGTGNGDSGGGLVYNNTLLGIHSWSYGFSDGYPSIHTNVYQHLEWINANIAEFGM